MGFQPVVHHRERSSRVGHNSPAIGPLSLLTEPGFTRPVSPTSHATGENSALKHHIWTMTHLNHYSLTTTGILPPHDLLEFVLASYPDSRYPLLRPKGLPPTTNMTRNLKSVALAIAGVILIPSCASTTSASTNPKNHDSWAVKHVQSGKASWYSIKTNFGTKTASGQRLENSAATAAHKTLPLGTKVRVINTANGKSEVVTITDRGPYIRGRIIDVTIGVAQRLGFVTRGVIPVKVEVLKAPVD